MRFIICGLLGFACIFLGIKALVQASTFPVDEVVVIENGKTSKENEGKYILAYGHITNETETKDKTFGVKAKSPVLCRTTMMEQYIRPSSNSSLKRPVISYSAQAEGSFSVDDIHYSNPSFPKDYKSKVFTSKKVTLDHGNFTISGEFLEPLTYGSYIYFKKWKGSKQVAVTELPTPKASDFSLSKGGLSYVRSSGKEVGSLSISYSMIDENELKDWKFSFLGKQENGVLVSKGLAHRIYDREITMQELEKELKSPTGGIVAIVIGLIFLGVMALPLILDAVDARKKNAVG